MGRFGGFVLPKRIVSPRNINAIVAMMSQPEHKAAIMPTMIKARTAGASAIATTTA
jgi:hypothetical protein